MAQLLKLKDAGSRWQKAIDALRKKPQEGIVRDEQDQPVAVVLPIELYDSILKFFSCSSGKSFAKP